MEIPGGGDLLRTLPPPELLSGGSPCPVTGSRTSSKESLSHPSLCALKENIHSHGELPYGIALASYTVRENCCWPAMV